MTTPRTTIVCALAALVALSCSRSSELGCGPGTPEPRVHIGPDVNVKVTCGSFAQAAVASLSNLGGGDLGWSATLEGDPLAFSLLNGTTGHLCKGNPVTVLAVLVVAAPSKVPGDTFDGRVTIREDDGRFPSGTVAVHAEVVAPSFSVEPAVVDFGDVPVGTRVTKLLNFLPNVGSTPITIGPPIPPPSPFTVENHRGIGGDESLIWAVLFDAPAVGDYQVDSLWSVRPSSTEAPPAGCVAMKTIPIHARVVPKDDAGVDGADAAREW